ncbi:hypothetical protein MIDIC_510038 [Alphaproteobacteria bacterium]
MALERGCESKEKVKTSQTRKGKFLHFPTQEIVGIILII